MKLRLLSLSCNGFLFKNTVISALIAVGRTEGVKSTFFAIMFILSAIVIYDAMGVRRAAGMHAKELNKINNILNEKFKLQMSLFFLKSSAVVTLKPSREYIDLGKLSFNICFAFTVKYPKVLLYPGYCSKNPLILNWRQYLKPIFSV